MSACHYCGKENEEANAFCAGCGTASKGPDEPLADQGFLSQLKKSLTELNALSASVIMTVTFVAQRFSGWLALNTAIAVTQAQKAHGLEHTYGTLDKLMPLMIVPFFVLIGVVTISMGLLLIPKHLKDTSPVGAAWVSGSWTQIVEGFAVGLIFACGIFVLFEAMGFHARNLTPLGGMAQDVRTILMASENLLSPPFEELVFRGVLYGGYRKSFGPTWAALLTTFMFVLLHLPKIMRLPIVCISLAGMSLACLWLRLRSKAIGPSIAAHVSFNAVITFFEIFG